MTGAEELSRSHILLPSAVQGLCGRHLNFQTAAGLHVLRGCPPPEGILGVIVSDPTVLPNVGIAIGIRTAVGHLAALDLTLQKGPRARGRNSLDDGEESQSLDP